MRRVGSPTSALPEMPSASGDGGGGGGDVTSSGAGSELELREHDQNRRTPVPAVEVVFRRETIVTLLRVVQHRVSADADAVRRSPPPSASAASTAAAAASAYTFEAACEQLKQTTQRVVDGALLEKLRADSRLDPTQVRACVHACAACRVALSLGQRMVAGVQAHVAVRKRAQKADQAVPIGVVFLGTRCSLQHDAMLAW